MKKTITGLVALLLSVFAGSMAFADGVVWYVDGSSEDDSNSGETLQSARAKRVSFSCTGRAWSTMSRPCITICMGRSLHGSCAEGPIVTVAGKAHAQEDEGTIRLAAGNGG